MSKKFVVYVLILIPFIVVAGYLRTSSSQTDTHTGCDLGSTDYHLEPKAESMTRFAVIGDFGSGDENEAAVAELVSSWNPDFIVSLGDTNYPKGAASSIDNNVRQYYGSFVESQRFYSALGNHDLMTEDGRPYFDYLTLPGNERFYTFTQGAIQFFALNSNPSEPLGIAKDSEQAAWLQEELAKSTAPFRIVFFHHAPYSSGDHGSIAEMQWDFAEWGVDAVLAGHEHDYERLSHDGILYIVNGLGGAEIRGFKSTIDQSEVRYNCGHGAMLVDATQAAVTFHLISVEGKLIDRYSIQSD
jgi:tartrate-resistant acid phosphatase type 5